MRRLTNEVMAPDDAEYLAEVEDILISPVFASMSEFIQHGATTCLAHCVAVSYLSWRTCKKYNLDARAAARAGLVHDMFLYDWHMHKEETGNRWHGLTHPKVALQNAKEHFELTELEEEIVLKHMWPLTFTPPKSPEAYVVLYHDKVCSTRETMGMPVF